MASGLSGAIAQQIAYIKQDVGRIVNRITRGVAQKALSDMKEGHYEIIASYYSGYSPMAWYSYINPKTGLRSTAPGYKRSYQLYSSLVSGGVIKSGRHGFMAKIDVGSSGMSDYTNSMGLTFPASGVFDLVWNKGNRGLPPGNPGYVGLVEINANVGGISMSGSPDNAMMDLLDQWWDVIGSAECDRLAGV